MIRYRMSSEGRDAIKCLTAPKTTASRLFPSAPQKSKIAVRGNVLNVRGKFRYKKDIDNSSAAITAKGRG